MNLRTNDIRRMLKNKVDFPKDACLQDPHRHFGGNRFVKQRQRDERAILHVLVRHGAPGDDKRLARQIANCTSENPCGEYACWLCNHSSWINFRNQCRDVVEDAEASPEDISFVTVIADVAECSSKEIRAVIRAASIKCERVLKSCCSDAKWLGRFELDVVPTTAKHFGAFKRRTLAQLGLESICGKYSCVVHLHALVVHRGVDREAIDLGLRLAFRGTRRAEAKWRERQKLRKSIDKVSQYITKCRPPEWASYGRGSRTFSPRDADAMLKYNYLMKEMFDNELRFERYTPRKVTLIEL